MATVKKLWEEAEERGHKEMSLGVSRDLIRGAMIVGHNPMFDHSLHRSRLHQIWCQIAASTCV